MSDLKTEISGLSKKYGIPDITLWRQGQFVDMARYSHMPDQWKDEQRTRESTLIRPGGGTNNALFQIAGAENATDITAYLEELGRIIGKLA